MFPSRVPKKNLRLTDTCWRQLFSKSILVLIVAAVTAEGFSSGCTTLADKGTLQAINTTIQNHIRMKTNFFAKKSFRRF